MEKSGSGSWKERIGEEFAKISSERSNAEKFWQRIKNLQISMNSKKETDKQAIKKRVGILKKIKESVLPSKEIADDKKNFAPQNFCAQSALKADSGKRWRRAEIQREKIILERKKEELRKKKEELAKKGSMLKD